MTGDPAPLDGPETYWVRLFYDIGATADEASQRAAADELWSAAHAVGAATSRTTASSAWPAAHPATVIAVRHGRWPVTVVVRIACDWLAREHEHGQLVDLHAAATSHALGPPPDWASSGRQPERAAPGWGEHLHMPTFSTGPGRVIVTTVTGTQPGGLHALGSDVGCAPFNAHRPRWGNRGNPPRGRAFVQVETCSVSGVLDVEVQLELVRVRTQLHGRDLLGALVVDPRLDQVRA